MQKHENAVIRYSIIIPAFEEEGLIASSLMTLHEYLKGFEGILPVVEVIVVAAKGNDRTAAVAQEAGRVFQHFQVIEPGPKVGKGRDVQSGMRAAKGMYQLFMDADLATPVHHIQPAFDALEHGGADVIIGERNLIKIHKDFKRIFVSIMGNRLIHVVLHLNYGDSQCGFKGFTAEAAQKIFTRQTIMGWGFDIELLTIAREQKLRVAKMPIPDWSDPKIEQGLVGESPISAAKKTLRELLDIRKKWKQGAYA